ncbi:MAG TPA: AmmeMemoRadiSam system radical SAM enzyme [Erysipelotrichaceae bacterium]|nr:AmmeMemoRadiSam system radical SAM enzyme [Erysipelotrichaceae bacterium]
MPTCDLCFHNCNLKEGQTGFCHARKNVNGVITSIDANWITSLALDPIEKKPLLHFYPGSKILSIGSFGCNLRCPFCQNHTIASMSFHNKHAKYMRSEEIVNLALDFVPQGNIGLAFTYNEPLIAYEFVLETAKLAKQYNLKTVLVTNGTINEKPLLELLPYIDAMNIDLKGFTQEFYTKLSGNLEQVKHTIELSHSRTHVELTSLIIPNENDSAEDMEKEARWIASIDPEMPLHLSRFFPNHLWMDKQITPLDTLIKLERIAKQYLKHVHLGNV